MKLLLTLAALALLTCPELSAQSTPTELRINAVDRAGLPIKLSRAELYLDIWGGGETVSLVNDQTGVKVPLDRDWLCEKIPDSCDDQFVEGRVILHAEGYSPVVSRSFLWMGSIETPGDAPRDSVSISFVSGLAAVVPKNASQELTIPFRRPAPRKLHLISQAGVVLEGVVVRASLLDATSNHCGAIEGELLAELVSDAAGEVTIPDADGEYIMEFGKDNYVLASPKNPTYPMRFVSALPDLITTVVLRALEKRPLRIQFTGPADLAGLALSACMAACPCGACCGQIGSLDSTGSIKIEEFFPENYDRLSLLDHEGRPIWQGTARTLGDGPGAGLIVIQLPKSPPILSAPVPLARPQAR